MRARIEALEAEVATLRASAHVMSAVIEETPLVIYAKGSDHRFVLTNRRHAELIGRQQSEILGHTDGDLFGDDAEAINSSSERVLSSGEAECSEFSLTLKSERRTFLETIFRLHDEHGTPVGLGGIAADITARRELENSLHIFETLAAQSPKGIAIFDLDSEGSDHARYVNPALRLLLKGSSDAPERASEILRVAEVLRKGLQTSARWQGVMELQRADDSRFPAQISGFLLSDDRSGRSTAGAFVTDLTESQQRERERERIANLVTAREAAEHASRLKSDFLASISHEIRTPIASVMGYADLMLQPETPTEEGRRHAASIQRNAEHLLRLLDDILDVSRIEAGTLTYAMEPVDLAKTFDTIDSLLRPMAIAQGVTLSIRCDDDCPRTVMADSLRLRQVLLNLVNNAIKFTDKGGVTVRASLQRGAAPGASVVQMTIQDSGIGIAEEHLPLLFKPFTQVHGRNAARGRGTGLGLAISARLTEGMGGTLSVRSALGKGSTFTVKLPIDRSDSISQLEPPASKVAPRDEQPLRSLRVLVAEDNPDLRELMLRKLRRMGVEPLLVENGREAVDRALHAQACGEPFDVVLLDMQMPVLDGYDAARGLRALGCSAFIVALTAFAMEGDEARCLSAGCDAYLSKPVDLTRLRALLDARLLQGAQ